ncbi:MAG: hypothetical protein IT341_06165 [Chloroflexi bacterium]|nr:hypothetical protein [Chloroflexota bacterium]
MLQLIRIGISAGSALLLIIGLALVATGMPAGFSGLWLVLIGGVGLVAVAFERMRYRSELAERGKAEGAGEGVHRFRPTEERFMDPTTRERLRVWVDPASGERQYRPDE